MKIRRRAYSHIQINGALMPDFRALLSGRIAMEPCTLINFLCPVSGREILLRQDDVNVLSRLPAGWIDRPSLDPSTFKSEHLDTLLERTLLLSDDPADTSSAAILLAEERAETIGWHPLTRLHHGMTRWSGVMGEEGARAHDVDSERERLISHVARHGPIPEHFPVHPACVDSIPLPRGTLLSNKGDPFVSLLHQRRTTRHFDVNRPVKLAALADALHLTFGALGVETLAPGMVAVKRTSPSGGALHPLQAYPLIVDVESLTPGFYHYRGHDHVLELIKPMDKEQARTLANQLVAGQDYFADAAALVFHVARLDRQFWKYRMHPKAMRVLLLDSGHLSQTFYLVAARLGLGAYYTAAINDADIETILCLDASARMVIGANGIGSIDSSRDQLHMRPIPLPEPG